MESLLTSARRGSHTYIVTRTYANLVSSPAVFVCEATRVVWNRWHSGGKVAGEGGGAGAKNQSGV